MSIATTILTTAHTLGQIRRASRERCVGLEEQRDDKGKLVWSRYRMGDRSMIIIDGSKIRIGEYAYQEAEAVQPSKRQCTAPECWECMGTGIAKERPCTRNDDPPF